VLKGALGNFLRNAADLEAGLKSATESFAGDEESILEQIKTVKGDMPKTHPYAGFLQGYQATVAAIKANEAVVGNKRVEIGRDLYELG
jgi:hypothetical protein